MAWLIVLIEGKGSALRHTPKKEIGYICLSGLATGASWLCYYKALHDGPASAVVPIDKLSILISVLFSVVVLRSIYQKIRNRTFRNSYRYLFDDHGINRAQA